MNAHLPVMRIGKIIACYALITAGFLAGTEQLAAQEPDQQFYVFDKNWKPTSTDKGYYFARVRKINDTDWEWDNYRLWGPLVMIEHYRDKEATIANGDFIYYNKKGRQDSICSFANNLAEGTWYFLNDTGRTYLKKIFHQGHLIRMIDAIREDSLSEADRIARGDSLSTGEKDAIFAGGLRSWKRYLKKNLRYPDLAIKANIQGEVDILFIVNTRGEVEDPEIWQSVEFSLDEEALRLIRNSPRWVPGEQGGKKVKSYKRQPIVYRLTD